MNNFIKIPYDKYHNIVINADELRKIEPIAYKNGEAAIEYHLTGEVIIQKFAYEYDPFEEHEKEWIEICKDGCKEDCEQCKLSVDFEEKYKSEGKRYNYKIMNSIIARIEDQLGVIDTGGRFLEGEITVIKKER